MDSGNRKKELSSAVSVVGGARTHDPAASYIANSIPNDPLRDPRSCKHAMLNARWLVTFFVSGMRPSWCWSVLGEKRR